MSLRTRRSALTVSATTALLLLAACGSPGAGGASPSGATAFVIGYAGGLSGMLEGFEKPALEAAKMAVEDINRDGGLNGKRVELITQDTKSDIDQGGPAGQALLAKGAGALLVTADYNFGGGAARAAQAAGVVAVSVGAGSPKFGVQGIGPLAFTMGTSGAGDGALTAEWAYEKRAARSAYVLLDDTTDYNKDQCRGFQTRWRELGGVLAGQDTFKNGDASISPQITRMKSLPKTPDVIAFCSYAPGGAVALGQLRSAGIDSLILTNSGMDGTYWFEKSMPELSGVALPVSASVWGDDPAEEVRRFVERYKEKTGSQPQNMYPVLAYAAVQAIVQAAKESGSTKGADMAEAMNKFTDKQLLIPVSFTKDTHIDVRRPARMLVLDQGKWKTDGLRSLKKAPPLFAE
ncbi:ABC transporter substrate-binding protein [Nonomuraea lactucae]|uniref:ABC transporter substrate-binding protein n=1 Tax=Nonomuraea lactucae TaxID=2249762 RepID=UPI000DE1E8EE|nr:ABC transporter substrate-binding protein [Nonomuraea lactucae]